MEQQITFRQQAATAAELYEQTFVPAIAEPAGGPLLELADLRPGERVLDLACGSGAIARRAAAAVGPDGSVAGVDVSPDMIAVAREVAVADHPLIEWHEADAASLPLTADSIDCVLCQMGLMFVGSAALPEVQRVLRPGGRFVLNTPGPIQPLFEILDRALVQHVDPDLGGFVRAVFSLHDPDGIAAMLGDAGFHGIHVESRTVALDLPTPSELLWGYIGSTPLGSCVDPASGEAKQELEAEVVDRWQAFVGDDGRLVLGQPMLYAEGRTS